MNYKVLRYYILLHCFMEVISACRQDSYPNLCDLDGTEYNASEFDDKEIICDCQTVIFCSVISFSKECNSSTIQLSINENATLLTQFNCNLLPLNSNALIPTLAILNSTANDIFVKFFANSLFGTYKVVCITSEISEELNKTVSDKWEIIDVSPAEIFVDSEVKLQLMLSKADDRAVNLTSAQCFVSTPDNDIEILSIMDISEDQITCAAFTPTIAGLFRVSLSYEFSHTLNKSFSVNVIGKHPVAIKAEYGSDFGTIFITFDANINLQSTCFDAFPKITLEYLGAGFYCYTRGNVLGIKMGAEFKLTDNITINSNNKICQDGYRHSGICLSVLPGNLTISKPKVSGPGLSFYTTNVCTDNKRQKYIDMRVFNLHGQTVSFQNQTLRPVGAGKTHRKNLMIWRTLRQIQSKFSSHLVLQVNKTDLLPLYENLSAFGVDLDAEDNNLSSGVSVSVYVQFSLTNSPLSVEAHVSFCDDHVKLFRYKWVVNGKNVPEEGRLLSLSNLPPGKYLIKCLVVGYDSTELLGQGWATAEVLENIKDVLIVPSEAVIGTADDIFLRVVTMNGNSVSWTCRTAVGEPCLTRNQNLLDDIFDFTSSTVSLPAGSLPVSEYTWTVESSGMVSSAKVSVKPGEVAVSVEIPNVFVDPSLGFILNGSVQGAKETCYARWSSVRQKGFSYLDLPAIAVGEISVDERLPKVKIPLVIPPSSAGLEVNSLYLFKFQVFCPMSGSLRYLKVPVRTSTPPSVLPVAVEPLTGKAMITNFKVSGAEADVSAQDYPLVFEWNYVDSCGTEVPLGRGLSVRNLTTYLPPGDVKIMMRVCNGEKICSTSLSPTITVIQPAEIRADNFNKTLQQIQYLMASGDSREALGLAVTIFKSLALIAEFEVREKVFSALEESINLRIKDLSEKLPFGLPAVKLALDFYEQTETVTKYLHKNSAILMRLKEFRDSIRDHSKSN